MLNRTKQASDSKFWLIRLGLFLVAVPGAINSVWGVMAPGHWFDNFGWNRPWAGALGPFNEHLVLDFSLSYLALSLLLLAAAVWLTKGLLRLSVTLWLLFALPHFAFHWHHMTPFQPADTALILGSLGIQVIVPLVLLFASCWMDANESHAFGDEGSESSSELDFRGIPPASGLGVSTLSWMTERQFGQPLETLKLVGHHSWLLFGTSMMEMSVDNFDSLDERLHSLISLRVAQIVGCPW